MLIKDSLQGSKILINIGGGFEMNEKELEFCKKNIHKKREELFLSIINEYENINEHEKLINYYGTHMADGGTDTMQSELKNYFTHRQLVYLQNMDHALERIKKGNYGLCIVCGKGISFRRLKIVPHTNYCVPCKS